MNEIKEQMINDKHSIAAPAEPEFNKMPKHEELIIGSSVSVAPEPAEKVNTAITPEKEVVEQMSLFG